MIVEISKDTVATLLMIGGLIELPCRAINGIIADRHIITRVNQFILYTFIAACTSLTTAAISGVEGRIITSPLTRDKTSPILKAQI